MKSKEDEEVLDLVLADEITSRIYLIRGQAVMFDFDLAMLYNVETRVLIQGVKRNMERFPRDFMFQLTKEELENWRSHFVISNPAARMGLRREPYVFTEHGVAMLSSVLRSPKAVGVNIYIVRAFVRMRKLIASNEELARKVDRHEHEIGVLFEHMGALMQPEEPKKKNTIGFVCP